MEPLCHQLAGTASQTTFMDEPWLQDCGVFFSPLISLKNMVSDHQSSKVTEQFCVLSLNIKNQAILISAWDNTVL